LEQERYTYQSDNMEQVNNGFLFFNDTLHYKTQKQA